MCTSTHIQLLATINYMSINYNSKINFIQLLFIKEVTSLLTIADVNLANNKELQAENEKHQLTKKITSTEDAEKWIDIHFYHYEFIPTLFHSLFTGMYSRFESFLKEVATIIESNNANRIKINDIQSRGIIDKYRKFLNLVYEIDNADGSKEEWKKFEIFQFLRNKIVHNESKLINNSNQDFKSTNGYKLLTEYKLNRIRKNGEFKIEDLKFLEDFGDLIMFLGQSITIELAKSKLNCG